MASTVTNMAVYFAGGCGTDKATSENKEIVVTNCVPSDAIDIYARNITATRNEGPLELTRTSNYKLSEPKYSAAAGVFWTNQDSKMSFDIDASWGDTPGIIFAGGIVEAGAGLYKATDSVDVLKEESVDSEGIVGAQNLITSNLVQSRFDMSSCCYKHICVFAGGQLSLAGYYSDRIDIWDGHSMSWSNNDRLSEARFGMGTALLKTPLNNGKNTMLGFFRGRLGGLRESLAHRHLRFHQ